MILNLKSSGVYWIRNLETHRVYIGSAVNFQKRWRMHLYQLRRDKHHSPILQRAWNKYGEQAFEFSVLQQCKKEDVIQLEQSFLDLLEPSYNVCRVAGSSAGRKTSIEASKSLSEAMRGRQFSVEHRSRISEALKGRKRTVPVSQETRAKISAIHKGRPKPRTPEHSNKIALSKRIHSDSQVKEIKALLVAGEKQASIAEMFKCSVAYVSLISSGKKYRDV